MADIGATGLGGFFNVAAMVTNNKMSADMASTSRLENYLYNERSAEAAYRRQIEMMENYFTPAAQIEQLKEAGLSPSLMYGKGGVTQGASAPQGAGPAGPQSQFIPLNPMVSAQIANLMADANLKNAQADSEKGENELGASEIAKNWADAGAKDASTKLLKAQTSYQTLINEITDTTKFAQISTIEDNANTAFFNSINADIEAKRSGIKFNYETETYKANVQQTINEAQQSTLNLLETRANIKLTQAQTEKIKKETGQLAQELEVKLRNVSSQEEANRIKEEFNEKFVEAIQRNVDVHEHEENKRTWIKEGANVFNTIISTAGRVASTAVGAGKL